MPECGFDNLFARLFMSFKVVFPTEFQLLVASVWMELMSLSRLHFKLKLALHSGQTLFISTMELVVVHIETSSCLAIPATCITK